MSDRSSSRETRPAFGLFSGVVGIAACAALLGGCSLVPGSSSSSRNYFSRANIVPVTPMQLGAGARSAAPAASNAVLALPSAAGAVKRVKERHYVNGTRQEIELVGSSGTPGQNVIDVSVRTSDGEGDKNRYLGFWKPSKSGIRNEILGRFPDVRMNIVTSPMTNSLGTFGLAIGRHRNGARCVFAWQWVDDLRDRMSGVSNITKFGAMLGGRQLAASVRIRLCQKGVTVDQLATYIQGLTVMGRTPLNRLVRMDRRNINNVETSAVSQSGIDGSSPLQPVGGTLESALARSGSSKVASKSVKPVKATRTRRKVRQPRARRSVRSSKASAASYNRVRHYSASGRAVSPASAPAVVPGSRYMAPVPNAPPPAPAPQAAGNYRPSGAVSLPPEAYRGPQR
ncbi:MAG: cellulose biosynthesis protein BcsN [Hyphomicrobiales bacterium]|nr:cellulose biosynthesis protein BcsN [Hyphomicrobiales bacterium]